MTKSKQKKQLLLIKYTINPMINSLKFQILFERDTSHFEPWALTETTVPHQGTSDRPLRDEDVITDIKYN